MTGNNREAHYLDANQDGNGGNQEGVIVEPEIGRQHQRPGKQYGDAEGSQRHKRKARIKEQPARAEHQQKTQVPPAVMPGAQMWPPRTTVNREGSGNLRNVEIADRGADHHFARQFHARTPQVERQNGVAAKSAQAAMKVTDFSAEEHAPDEAQQRISEVTVQERHRPRRYP